MFKLDRLKHYIYRDIQVMSKREFQRDFVDRVTAYREAQ